MGAEPEVTAATGWSSSSEHELLWVFVDDTDRPIADETEAVTLLCTLQSVVMRAGVTDWPMECNDCFCDDRPLRGDHWRNSGNVVRYIARAVREQLARDQIAAQFTGH